jgi:hypothetical protein
MLVKRDLKVLSDASDKKYLFAKALNLSVILVVAKNNKNLNSRKNI